MNKLTKLGASALCGSLATIVSANAGSLSVTGGVDMSWSSVEKGVTGNPIGMGSNLTFSGSGELDNGTTFALTVAHTNQNAYSNTNVVITMPTLGDIRIDQGTTGTGIDRMDDVTPTAWEEAWGTALGTGIDLVEGVSSSTNIEWTPGMLPDGITARLAWTPRYGTKNVNDKGMGGDNGGGHGAGHDITVQVGGEAIGMDGLTLYAGTSTIDAVNGAAQGGDLTEHTAAIKYAVGGFTFGYQYSQENKKGVGATAVSNYENDMWGVAFNVNDDLTISYNNAESAQDKIGAGTDTTLEASSIQLAYTMGGASIRIAEATVDNKAYASGAANSMDGTTISLSLAF
jgi:outer membrane protein OmpU